MMASIANWRALGFVAAAAAMLASSAQWAGASSTSVQMAQAPGAASKPAAAPAKPGGAKVGPSVLRVVPHAPLVVLDPTWTSIYITRNHGYMIYDTLFALDAEGKPRPQMVDTWTTSDDGLTWTFKLRDGLKWHDGADVTADDCIASLKRWAVRGGEGQLLFTYIDTLTAPDPKTIVMKLRARYDYVLPALSQLSSYVPFMLPKRVVDIDPARPIDDYTGSGPFIFKKDEFVPGKKAVYVKNPAYVPRSDPTSWAAGGKNVKVDRIEWTTILDQRARVEALLRNRTDYLEEVSPKLVGRLERNKNIVIGRTGPDPFVGIARFNHLAPPFDKVDIRRAAMMAMSQTEYMKAAIGPQKFWRTCYSVFPCNSPLTTEIDSDFIKKGTLDGAREALRAAGYDGAPVIILNAIDVPVVADFVKVTADRLRKIGMKVEVQDTDWATMTTRRAQLSGWNLFLTFWSGVDLSDPSHIAFSGDPQTGWFGWPADQDLEALRREFVRTPELADRKAIAAKIQQRMWAIGASAYLGEFFLPVAFRSTVEGGIVAPVQFYWNMSIK